MAEKGYKLKVLKEIISLSDVPSLTERQKKFLKNFANDLVKKDESEIRKSIYATFRQGGARGGEIRGLLPVLPESSELRKTALGKKPEYKKGGKEKLAEMFADEGGINVIDQRKEEFWQNNLDKAKIEAIAKANGLTTQELYKRLRDETIKETRRQIAEGETTGDLSEKVGALALGLAFPRGIEAVREGRDVTEKDLLLDTGENLMYTINPATRAGQLGLRGIGLLSKTAAEKAGAIGSKIAEKGVKNLTIGTGLNAFANPILFETADAILYDEGPRAKFNTTDALSGGLTNLVVPPVIRSQFMKAGRLGGVKGGRADTKTLEKVFGETKETATEKAPKTFNEFAKELEQKLDDRKQYKEMANFSGAEGNIEAYLSPKQLKEFYSVSPIYEDEALNEAATEIAKLVGQKNISLNEATKTYFAKLPKDKQYAVQNAMRDMKNSPFRFYKNEFAPTSELATAISNSSWAPVLQEGSFITEAAKKAAEKEAEKEAKKSATRQMLLGGAVNWAANKYGDTKGGGLLGVVSPFVSPFYDIEEHRKKEKEEKEKAEEAEEMQGYIFPFESEESEGL
jgi:hypothetical protein